MIAQLHGGQDEGEREHVKAVFQDELGLDPMRILLAADAASEGINLQGHCHRLLHWEIPWNPNRLPTPRSPSGRAAPSSRSPVNWPVTSRS